MRFRSSRRNQARSSLPSHRESPQVDLVPMMDVLMSILTFFIISAMSLQGGGSVLNVNLPQAISAAFGDRPSAPRLAAKPLVIELLSAQQIAIDAVPVPPQQLPQQIQTYLAQNPQGQVLVRANRDLTYADVTGLLKTIREVGGDRVSLAIERPR